ncbi:MAG TPA: metallophosphoesterase [Mariprofundaceae bacterium]|nr:metallophosphoesterase [Mariprofundaceae bacterium]
MPLLLHITDTHLYGDKHRLLKGISTHASCAAVSAHARALFPHAEAIILGGDMSQDESEASYMHLRELLCPWQKTPFMLTPGNHANLEGVQKKLIPSLAGISGYYEHLHSRNWHIIALNSHAPGKVAGLLAVAELERLDELLSDARGEHALLALHHPPVAIGSRWMDQISLANADAFWAIIDKHPKVRAVLCGHIHQELDVMRGKVRVLGTPSTCIQFKPNCEHFMLDGLSPGYRWLDLLDSGRIDTGVERVAGFIPSDLNDNAFY